MQRAVLILLSVLAILIVTRASAAESVTVTIETAAGETIRGSVGFDSLEIATDFGRAEVNLGSLATIEFGDPATVVTDDGTALRGTLQLRRLAITADGVSSMLPTSSLRRLAVIREAAVVPGEITDGTASNQVTYCLRAPESYQSGSPWPAMLILHGSSMNARMYVETIVAAWPDLARRYVLIGIDGEQRVAGSPPDQTRFNYTYVGYMGRSTYRGYPGTDRQSPALVMEVLDEIEETLDLSTLFVGGHSQGGYLAYSILMNSAERVDGVFPVSGGLIVQCEPTAFDDVDLMAAQHATPIAIVHGTNDPVVDFDSGGRYAWEVFEDAGFPMVGLITDDQAAHMFARLPIDDAVGWLEVMSSDDPERLSEYVEDRIAADDFRNAIAGLSRLRSLGTSDDRVQWLSVPIEAAAAESAAELRLRVDEDADASWVDDFLEFRATFAGTAAARPLLETYEALRAQHAAPADNLFQQARAAFARRDPDAAYAAYERIANEYYASCWYRLAERSLARRAR